MKQDQNSEKLLSTRADNNDDKAIRREGGGEVGGEAGAEGRSQSLRSETAAEREAGALRACREGWLKGSVPWVCRAFRQRV